MHSFSYHVKEEILAEINNRQKADSCLLGLLTFCNSLSDEKICLLTEHKSVSGFFQTNINRICDAEAVKITEISKRSNLTLYCLEIPEYENRIAVLEYFRTDSSRRLTQEELPIEKFYPQVIAGAFLACGSVNNPMKKYHLEFVIPTLNLCNDLGILLLDNYDILCKHTQRKQTQVVYLKESENIIDMLTLMGASNGSLELMNVKIEKDMRNKINRAVNCDNANIEKALKAAERQIGDIELIDDEMGIGSLPDNLREIAELRYNNPDYNLSELGAELCPPISRSGANHRLQKIAAIADEIRDKRTVISK